MLRKQLVIILLHHGWPLLNRLLAGQSSASIMYLSWHPIDISHRNQPASKLVGLVNKLISFSWAVSCAITALRIKSFQASLLYIDIAEIDRTLITY
jgi:hypothetical protein